MGPRLNAVASYLAGKRALPAAARQGPGGGGDAAARTRAVWLAFGLAAVFALATGLAESAVIVFVRFYLHRFTHVPLQVVWMAPVAYAALFALPAALCAAAAWRRPDGRALDVLVAILAFVSAFSVLLHATQLFQVARVLLAAGVAARAATLIPALVRRHPRLVPAAVVALGLVAALLGASYNAALYLRERQAIAGLPAAPAGAPNVLLLIWDTVRAGSLGIYGYDRPTTPNLQALAKRGVTFAAAISTAPWTLPSHAGMFTGRLSAELSVTWLHPLDDRYPTLPEVLARNGYATAGFVGNTYYLARESGLDRGMAHYESFGFTAGDFVMRTSLGRWLANKPELRTYVGNWQLPGRKTATRIRRDVLRWIDRRPAGHPFFAFVNLYDAHMPYLPPPPYDTMFRTVRVDRRPLVLDFWRLTPAQRTAEHDAYDASIAYLDSELGALLRGLSARGLLDNTIVIVAADHGEEWGEHGVYQHGNSLYMPALRVPLVIAGPKRLGLPAGRVDAPVSLSELPATVTDLLDLDREPFPGRSLARFWDRNAPGRQEARVVSEVGAVNGAPGWYPIREGDMRSLVEGGYHLIRRGSGRLELFDLRHDIAEHADLAGDPRFAGVVERMRRVLDARAQVAQAPR